MRDQPSSFVDAAIIGSGFAGLGAAIKMKEAGYEDFVVFERADEVGGVWRDNRYPGCACDTDAHLYSFSFAPKPDWSQRFAPRAEILDYLKQCATDFGVRPHVRFGEAVEAATWNEDAGHWRLRTRRDLVAARVLVSGIGTHADPAEPDLPGRDAFAGRAFHSAHWPAESIDWAGKRVAVVGTGASAIQLVPALQPAVAHLTLFQRTPPWVTPRGNRRVPPVAQQLFERFPAALKGWRRLLYEAREVLGLAFRHPSLARLFELLARLHLRRQIPSNAALRRVLTPTYAAGCKRVLHSDAYYPSLDQPNVTVVDGPATAFRSGGVAGPDGAVHEADVVVFCTGFQSGKMPLGACLYGRDGRSLQSDWQDRPRAYLGTTVAGFPNLFLLRGPNTGLGHNAVLPMIEAQIEHVLGALRFMRSEGAQAVEPRAEAQAAFVAEVERRSADTVWTSGGCDSWYLDAEGRNTALWPGPVDEFRARAATFDPAAYVVKRRASHRVPMARAA